MYETKGAAEFHSERLGPCVGSFTVCYTKLPNKINNYRMRDNNNK